MGSRNNGGVKKRNAYANRRPVLDIANAIPEELVCAFRRALHKIKVYEHSCDERLHKTLKVILESLGKLNDPSVTSTPELQIQALSRITGCVKETPMGDGQSKILSEEEVAVIDILTHEMICPLLLDCRVRYLHRGLTTLLRAICRSTDEDLKKMEIALLDSIKELGVKPIDKEGVLSEESGKTTLHLLGLPSDQKTVGREEYQNKVMMFLNNIDCLSSTLIPFAPSIFSHTFSSILPLLGDSLRWCVGNVTATKRYQECAAPPLQSLSEQVNDTGAVANAVLGEDLEQIRFCVRVVASYVHKYMNQLSQYSFTTLCQIISEFLEPSIAMLSSYRFPKDVLNATALLVVSLITVKHCSSPMIGMICFCICDEKSSSSSPLLDENPKTKNENSADGVSLSEVVNHKSLEKVVHCLCGDDEEQEWTAIRGEMSILLSHLTTHGRFALLKGFLAHFSSLQNDRLVSLSVLLETVPNLLKTEKRNSAAINPDGIILYDLIVPLCCKYFRRVDLPETRFMAIQTVDCMIRHLAAVLGYLRRLADGSLHKSLSHSSEDLKRATDYLLEVCVRPDKVGRLSRLALQLSTEVWDDSTTQVSGALYDTYNVLLSVNQYMSDLMSFSPGVGNEGARENESHYSHNESLLDVPSTLRAVLSIQNDRRGKYHALLGLLSAMNIKDFINGLCLHYLDKNEGRIAEGFSPSSTSSAIEMFCKALLSCAANHKVASVAGDTMRKFVERIQNSVHPDRSAARGGELMTETHQTEKLHISLIISSVARALVQPGYVKSSSNINTSTHISHISAHFVCPLLKWNKMFADDLMNAMLTQRVEAPLETRNSVEENGRLSQSIVEVLTRAKGVGIDVQPYLRKDSDVFQFIIHSLRNYKFEQRIAALQLCIVSPKKGEPISAWQCKVVEQFVSRNMHCGGDSAARKTLVSTFQKWVNRLVESFEGTKSVSSLLRKKELEKANECMPSSEDPFHCNRLYIKDVLLPHLAKIVDVFVVQIGTCVSESEGLSVERKVTACACYKLLLQSFRRNEKLHKITEDIIYRKTVVGALLRDLSDGWSQMRQASKQLLDELLSGPCGRSLQQHYHSSNTDTETLLKKTFSEITSTCTYRGSEGAVQRYILFLKCHCVADLPHQEVIVSILRKCFSLMGSFCEEVECLRGKALYQFITQHPIHGLLSLSTELFDILSHRTVCGGEDLGFSTCSEVELKTLMNQLFHSSKSIIRTCGALAGHEVVGESEVVDCRGHVYDKSNEASEAVMRYVVNNTWLGIRVATMCIQRATSVVEISGIEYGTVRSLCYELVNALLATKHNGVMRCVRSSLKSLMHALVRCRSPEFYHLPSELLLFLMGPEGVTSDDISRMLRRSQGLPHAILAVLEAEDDSVPPVLFPMAMRTLLRISEYGDGKQPEEGAFDCNDAVRLSQRSNAMNVLKFIFENKVFAERVVADVESTFMIATSGFDHQSWYIRNSSLMLFSAVLQRFVGEHPSTGGGGVNTSLHDISLRTPKGVAYAYEALKRGIERERGVCVTGVSPGVGRAQSDLAMFPLLQMLSMLSPDPPHLASSGGFNDGEAMIEVVFSCSESRNLMIRAASACSLPCLVPPSLVGNVIRRISLPQDQVEKQSLNWAHGSLLQLQNFHNAYVGTLRRKQRIVRSPYACKDLVEETVTAITEVLLSGESYYRSAASCCPVVCACLLDLMADVLFYGNEKLLTSKSSPTGSPDEAEKGLSSLFRRLVLFGAQVLNRFVVSAKVLSTWSRAGDSAALEAASRFFVFSTKMYSHWTDDSLMSMMHTCRTASQEPFLRPSADYYASFDSSVTHHLHTYYKEEVLSREDFLHVVDVMRESLSFDLIQRSLNALEVGVEGCCLPALKSWHLSDQTDHLHFLSVIGAMRPIEADCLSRLEEKLLVLLSTATSAPRVSAAWCTATLQFLCTVASSHSCGAIPSSLLCALESLGAPERPQRVRLAALDALAGLLRLVHTQPLLSSIPPSQVIFLFLQLLSFLVDDSFDIRERACHVCAVAGALSGPSFASQSATVLDHLGTQKPSGCVEDPQSCALYVVALLRRVMVGGDANREETHSSGRRAAAACAVNEEEGPPGVDAHVMRQHYRTIVGREKLRLRTEVAGYTRSPEVEEEEEDQLKENLEEDDDEQSDVGSADGSMNHILFHKENDNMYAEPTVLKYYEDLICSVTLTAINENTFFIL